MVPPSRERGGPLLRAEAGRAEHDVGPEHVEPNEFEHAALDWPEDGVDGALEPGLIVGRLKATSGEGEQRALSVLQSGLVFSAAPIEAPHSKHAVDPALEDPWQAEPPQRKLLNHQIAGLKFA